MQRRQEWSKLKNILCVRPDNIGDVIMTVPAIAALKQSVPGRKITLLASSGGAAIARYIPDVDDVIVFNTPWVKGAENVEGDAIGSVVAELRERQFDAAVIFTVYSQNPLPSAMICYMAGIRRIAGYCRENPYHLMTDWIPDKEPFMEIKHEVQRQLDLAENLGGRAEPDMLRLSVPDACRKSLARKLALRNIDERKDIVLLHPGVSEEKRRFPADKFASAADMLAEDPAVRVIITGSASEKMLGDSIVKDCRHPVINLAGELSLGELIALIRQARVLISNNTGPVHIAAAMQTPVVVLYALTNPQHTPWKVRNKVLPFDVPENMRSKNIVIDYAYRRSFRKKPAEIHAKDIAEAAKELLEASAGKGSAAPNILHL